MVGLGLVICLFLTFGVNDVYTEDDTLKLAQVLYRHGDRSAVRSYPTDKAGEAIWPQGFGQLTMEGMRQHYSLGQYFRQRYINKTGLLNKSYTKNQIRIRSTDLERTLMSAESDLSGMFPPGPDQQWNKQPGNVWQPIPVHTVPQDDDELLYMARTNCPRLDQLQEELSKSNPYKEEIQKHEVLLKYLSEKSGIPFDFHNLTGLYDTFFCMQQNNLTQYWPDWMNMTIFHTLKEFQNIDIGVTRSVPEINKISGGPFVNRLIENMRTRQDNKSSTERMFMYSAHDTTVSTVLSTLNVFDPKINPPYISCVMVELYQRSDSSYYVRVFYRNDSTGATGPYLLQIPGCDTTDCDFPMFVKATSNMTFNLHDLPTFCKAHFQPSATNIAITVVSVVLAITVVISLSCCYVRRKRKTRYKEYLTTGQEQRYDDDEEMDLRP